MESILFIDDDQIILTLAKKTLTISGYNILLAENAFTGIRLAKQYQPRLIFCDIMLPDMEGGETVRQLRKNPETKSIPIIFLTSLISDGDIDQSSTIVDDEEFEMLAKPMNPELMLKKIKEYTNYPG